MSGEAIGRRDVLDLLSERAPEAVTRHRILVENAEALYGFAKSS